MTSNFAFVYTYLQICFQFVFQINKHFLFTTCQNTSQLTCLINKHTLINKQAGHFVTYMKDCQQGGKNVTYYMKHCIAGWVGGWILFSKILSEHAFLLGRSEYSTPPLHTPHCLCFKLFKRKNISRSTTTPLARLLLSRGLSSIYSQSIRIFKRNTPGPWLLRISMVRFSLVQIFKKQPKYIGYAIFTKGQLISKCLFGVFNSPKKTNENNST